MHDEPDAGERLQDDRGQREEEIREDSSPRSDVPRGRLRLASSTEEKNAMPRPVPNRTVEVRICSVLMAR
jgi:hypothetical protein